MVNASFSNLDFGTKVTTSGLEVIGVTINPDLIINDFAQAYANELYRRNPVRAQAIAITVEELQAYFTGLIAIRVESVYGSCKVWRQAKQLLIPAWIEFTLTQVGEVLDTDRGFRIMPKFEYEYDLDAMLTTSDKLRAFISDGLVLLKDAFPRETTGCVETMSMAIIDAYVQSMDKESHPIASYVAAFLGFKLQEETAFKMLYRSRYDDIEFIRAMILREGSLY